MVLQGDIDTGDIGFSIKRDGHLHELWKGVVQLEVAYRYQNQNLGFMQSLFSDLTLQGGIALDKSTLLLDLGWEQTWISAFQYSDFVTKTFEDRYDGEGSAPKGTLLFLSALRFRTGIAGEIGFSDHLVLTSKVGILWTPNPFLTGFDGMMFGLFPFYGSVAFSYRL
jgi:hypothetical protein